MCDEGHILRKEGSHISKALNALRTKRRVLLTGTPLQNNLVECEFTVSRVIVTSKSTPEHTITLVWLRSGHHSEALTTQQPIHVLYTYSKTDSLNY